MKKILTVFTALVVVFGVASQVAAKDVSVLNSEDMQRQTAQLVAVLKQEVSAESSKYENDYKAFLSIFSQKTYNEVITDAKYFLSKSDKLVFYDGKKYNRVALLHAALHNLVSRKHIAPNDKEFTLVHKVSVMPVIYDIAKRVGLNPADENALLNFATEVASSCAFGTRSYFAEIFPGLATPAQRQEAREGRDRELKQTISVASAIAVLPLVSKTDDQKKQSAEAIYKATKELMSIGKASARYGIIIWKVSYEALERLQAKDILAKVNRLEKTYYRILHPQDTIEFEEEREALKYAPEVLYTIKTIRPAKAPGEMIKKTKD